MNSYWEQRHLNESLEVFNSSDDYVKWLRKQYEETSNSINEKIYNHLSKIAESGELSLVEAKKYLNDNEAKIFKWDLEKFKKNPKLQKELNIIYNRRRISRLQAMETQLNLRIKELMSEEEKELFDRLGQTYEESYKSELDNLNKILDVNSLYGFNKTAVEKAINTAWSNDGKTFSNRIWERGDKLANTLRTNLTQSIIRGDNLKTVSKNIDNIMNAGYKNAVRLVRTEVNAIHNSARIDTLKDFDVEEVEINAKLDSRTSDICMDMNGKVVRLADAKAGVTIPPFHPNCRSVIIPFIDDDIQREIEESAFKAQSGNREDIVDKKEKDIVDKKTQKKFEKYPNLEKIGNVDKIRNEKELKEEAEYLFEYFNKMDIDYVNDRDNARTIMREIMSNRYGFDDLPEVVDNEVFDELAKNNKVLYRGVGDNNKEKYVDQFKTGEFFQGKGGEALYGRGTYFTDDLDVLKDYGGTDNPKETIVAMFKEDAKIASYEDIRAEARKFSDKVLTPDDWKNWEDWRLFPTSDDAFYAMMQGYDGYIMNNEPNHIIIFNRSALIVKGG